MWECALCVCFQTWTVAQMLFRQWQIFKLGESSEQLTELSNLDGMRVNVCPFMHTHLFKSSASLRIIHPPHRRPYGHAHWPWS